MSDISWYTNTRNHIVFIALYQRSGKILSSLIFSPELSKTGGKRSQKQKLCQMNIMFPNKTGLSKWRIHTQHIYRPV